MVRGPLRVVLWVLGSLGIVWLILSLYSGAWMGGMGGMMDGMIGGETGGMMDGGIDGTPEGMPMAGGMGAMMGMMLVQTPGDAWPGRNLRLSGGGFYSWRRLLRVRTRIWEGGVSVR